MIYYDSGKWSSLLKIRGSVLPKATLWALPSAICAYLLEWASQNEYINVEALDVLTQGDIYSGFTYVLGFSLVFRTSQAYSRYWTAATSIHEMASEWSDSCVSLIAFTSVSRAPVKEVQRFRHTIVRMFSLLHAVAMSEVARVEDTLPLIDVAALSPQSLMLLTSSQAQGRKVHIVLNWIKTYITQQAASGLLNIPAPLLTRVFQELGAGLVKFHTAQQVVIWPFPFPYTQLNVLLIEIYTVITPLVISTWRTWPIICALFTFISVTFLVGLDLIASELENPFGDDPNDLPVLELQKEMNNFLIMLLNPAAHAPPDLLPSYVRSHRELLSTNTHHGLKHRLMRSNTPAAKIRATLKAGIRRDKLVAQMRWCGEEADESELHRLKCWLVGKASSMEGSLRRISQPSSPKSPTDCNMDDDDDGSSSGSGLSPGAHGLPKAKCAGRASACNSDEEQCESSVDVETSETAELSPPAPCLHWGGSLSLSGSFSEQQVSLFKDFLTNLRGELSEHLSAQLEAQKQEVHAIEAMARCASSNRQLSARELSTSSWRRDLQESSTELAGPAGEEQESNSSRKRKLNPVWKRTLL